MTTTTVADTELVAELVAALLDSQNLLEIANSIADELTLVAHTTGISSDAADVLRDYDGMFMATRTANKQVLAKARELAA